MSVTSFKWVIFSTSTNKTHFLYDLRHIIVEDRVWIISQECAAHFTHVKHMILGSHIIYHLKCQIQ